MKFAVVGAGAIGAFLGAMLARSDHDVTLIARGAHFRAMKERGVRVFGEAGDFTAFPKVTDNAAEAGTVDVVLLTLKAHSLSEMAPRLAPLVNERTVIVSAQNGIPWWYFYRHGGEFDGLPLRAVDPSGVIGQHIDSQRIIGCVIYCSTIITEPGVIEHIEGTRFSLGEPSGERSQRCQQISEAFIRAGLRCPVRSDIRRDIWVKLMGSVAFNPISALSRSTLLDIVRCPETRVLSMKIMAEAEEVARRLGVDIGITIKQRLAGAEKVGHHKTSMLQDIESGRPPELEAVVGAVVELGNKLNVDMTHTTAVYACTKLLSLRACSGFEKAGPAVDASEIYSR